MHPYRVFVSYSRDDRELVKKLVDSMEQIKLKPVWDDSIRPGSRFSDVIKNRISHAHVFMPVLTSNSIGRPWVHQETGYAMGMNIPVLPVAVGEVPSQMISDLHALEIDHDVIDHAADTLGETIEGLLNPEPPDSEATFRTAPAPEMRAELLARYTHQAILNNASGPMRQAGALSSFCLPKDPPDHPVWRQRDGEKNRSSYLYGLLQKERLAFEEYAMEHGCALILDPTIAFTENGPEARRTRLKTLLDFLKDDKIADVRVAIRQRLSPGNLTICGDWFTADSLAPRPGEGYFGTAFSWHAPTVWQKATNFEYDFTRLLKQSDLTEDSSREAAIRSIEEAMLKQ